LTTLQKQVEKGLECIKVKLEIWIKLGAQSYPTVLKIKETMQIQGQIKWLLDEPV
jgi:uncharacterized protein YqgV (UPF0045/DUF77 family)